MLFSGLSLGWGYPSAEMQSAYSTPSKPTVPHIIQDGLFNVKDIFVAEQL